LRFGFPRQARLLTSRQFEAVYRGGVRLNVFPLRIVAAARPAGRSRLGLAIGRKTDKAAARNRWKRLIRESFRLQRHGLSRPWDIVVSVDRNAERRDAARVPEAFARAVRELNAHEPKGTGQ